MLTFQQKFPSDVCTRLAVALKVGTHHRLPLCQHCHQSLWQPRVPVSHHCSSSEPLLGTGWHRWEAAASPAACALPTCEGATVRGESIHTGTSGAESQ